MLEGEF